MFLELFLLKITRKKRPSADINNLSIMLQSSARKLIKVIIKNR